MAPIAACFLSAIASAEPSAKIVESKAIWHSQQRVTSTDIARFGDQWVCVVQSSAGLKIIRSHDGETWHELATVTGSDENRPLYNARLTVANGGRETGYLIPVLVLTAVAPGKQCGGCSKSWMSRDGVDWELLELSADDNYLVSNAAWHVGVTYNLQRGSICGNATTVRIACSDDNGRSYHDLLYEETFSEYWPGNGALVFSQDHGFCVMQLKGKDTNGAIGVSRAPFIHWQWKRLPMEFAHPNAIRMESGALLVAAGLRDERGEIKNTLCELDPAVLELIPLAQLPEGQAHFVGLASHGSQVCISYHKHNSGGSTVHTALIDVGVD